VKPHLIYKLVIVLKRFFGKEIVMDISTIISSWGPLGLIGFAGCYLVTVGIAGQYVSIGKWKLVKGRTSRLTKNQRLLFSIFGSLLAAPLMIQFYLKAVHNEPVILYQDAKVDEYVKPVDSPKPPASPTGQQRNLSDGALVGVNYSPHTEMTLVPAASPGSNAAQKEGCQVVESFGLDQRSIRGLKYAGFQKSVSIYVGDIHYTWYSPTTVYIVAGSPDALPTGRMSPSEFSKRTGGIGNGNKWALNVGKQGDSTQFIFNGKSYRVTVKEIYASLFGTDKIAVEICESN